MDKKTVLVVGGAGFIGSMVNKMLHQKGYNTIVLDNLSRGDASTVVVGTFVHGDIGDSQLLEILFQKQPIHAVMHFAALTDVGESVRFPEKYYQNNVANTLTLLEKMIQHNIKTFIFSSTAAVYGNPQTIPIQETHPLNPINPYGRSKLMVEQLLADLETAHGLRSCSLRYFNAAGGDPEGDICTNKLRESNLIPLLFKHIVNQNEIFTINGDDYPTKDGTCVRDYIHIYDIATAHIKALEEGTGIYNLGNGKGFTIKEVIEAVEKVTGQDIDYRAGPRRPGDPPALVADATKAQIELGWRPQYPRLEDIVEHGWKCYNT